MKKKVVIIVIIILIILLPIFIIVKNNRSRFEHPESDKINKIGNSANNLLMGGRVAKQDNIIYFSTSGKISNSISAYNMNTGKSRNLKSFIAIPSEICVVGNNIFYKKNVSFSSNSPLYKMNVNGKENHLVIENPVETYNVYNDSIFYTFVDSKGLFKCDINGKTPIKIIDKKVKEFCICGDYIYYITNKNIRRYNLLDNTDIALISCKDFSAYHLTVKFQNMFFVKSQYSNPEDEILVKVDLNSLKKTYLYNGSCAFLHLLDKNTLLFLSEEYMILDINTLDVKYFKESLNQKNCDISELYTFDSQIFILTNNHETEKLVCFNFDDKKAITIN